MKRYKLYYSDRYCWQQCNGSTVIHADSLAEARKLAIAWLCEHGGTEGLSWEITLI